MSPDNRPFHRLLGCLANRLGWALAWMGLAAALPLAAQAQMRGYSPPARAEAWISDARPYVQQTVIYTVRVYHGAAKELNPEPIEVAGASVERIDGPPETTRSLGGQQLYSDFRYALTPLDDGPIQVPPLSVKVVPAPSPYSAYGNPYNSEFVVTTGSVNLDARATDGRAAQTAAAAGQTWLALHGLELDVELARSGPARLGEPLTLTVRQTAVGSDGEQLPSIEALLSSPDFKVYSEQAQYSRAINSAGNALLGTRSQVFTLVPTRAGDLQIPALELYWWDARADRMSSTRWAGMLLPVRAARSEHATDGAAVNDASTALSLGVGSLLLIVVVAAISFVLGWWLRAGRPGLSALGVTAAGSFDASGRPTDAATSVWQRAGGPLRRQLKRARNKLGDRFGAYTEFLLLARTRRRLGEQWQRLRPRWLVLWRLRRAIAATNNPKKLERLVQRYAALQMDLPSYASLADIRNAISRHYPKLTADAARQLLDRLDAGLYGNQSDYPGSERCNKDLCCLLRSMGLRCPPGKPSKRRATLPTLNPHHAP